MNNPVDPPVKCGYCGWLIGGCNNILSHKCLEHYDEDQHFLNVDDNFVVTLITREATTVPAVQEDDLDATLDADESLILAVFKRPALYNHELPAKERTKLKKDALWLEIQNTLRG